MKWKIGCFFVFLGLLFPFLASAGNDSPPSMKQYVACAKAIGLPSVGYGLPFVPAIRTEIKGFYVYTDQTAYFYPLGVPQKKADSHSYYYFRLSGILNQSDVYLGVHEDPEKNQISVLKSPAKFANYSKLPSKDALDDEARTSLSAAIQERVRSIAERYKKMADGYQKAGAHAPDKSVYLDGLGACSLAGDKKLHDVVVLEKTELENVAPLPSSGDRQSDKPVASGI